MGKMKDSSLLRWTQTKNNNNTDVDNKQVDIKQAVSEKKEKKPKKEKQGKSKKWLHKSENLTSGHVAYLVKFLGSTEVDKPKGIEVVKEGIRKLKFIQQLKKSEGTKTPKVELTVSVDGLAIQEPKSKKIQHQYPLHRISYCADDKAEKRFFSFIAKEADSDIHTCYVFVSDKLAEDITLTMGQAFDLAYKRFLLGKSAEPETEKISRLERENTGLRERLLDLASMLDKSKLSEYMEKNKILELGLVGEEVVFDSHQESLDEDHDTSKENCSNVMEVSVDSAIDTRSCRLMNFHAPPAAKLDTITIDDLDDDDFDPRSSTHCNESTDIVETHEVNPKSTPGLRNPILSINTPCIEHPVSVTPQPHPTRILPPPSTVYATPQAHPTRILPPPSIPPRDSSKIQATPSPTPPVKSCPFGMKNFDKGIAQQDLFSSGPPYSTVDFSLDELDPLRK